MSEKTDDLIERLGWTFVPPDRHPEMPAADGKIIVMGQVLLQHSTAHVENERRYEAEKVEKQITYWLGKVAAIGMPAGFTPIDGYVSYEGRIRPIQERKLKETDE